MGGGTCIRGRARRQTRYSSPERAPRLFHPLVLSRPRVLPFCTPIRPSHWQIPVLFPRSSNPSGPPPDRPGRMSDLTSNPAPIPSLHPRAWTNYIDKRSSIAGQCRNPSDLPASCVRLVSLIFLLYYSNAFPCQVMQSEANCTHPSSSFTRTIPGLLPSPFPPPSTAAEVCAGAELLRHHHSDRFYGPKIDNFPSLKDFVVHSFCPCKPPRLA